VTDELTCGISLKLYLQRANQNTWIETCPSATVYFITPQSVLESHAALCVDMKVTDHGTALMVQNL
jgi:hypothetical protein